MDLKVVTSGCCGYHYIEGRSFLVCPGCNQRFTPATKGNGKPRADEPLLLYVVIGICVLIIVYVIH